jgi:hypothetical protein
MVFVTKPKCSKTQRNSKSDLRKLNSKNVLREPNRSERCTLSQSKSSPPDLSDFFTGF